MTELLSQGFSMLNFFYWRSILEFSPANTCHFLLSFTSNCAIKTLQSWQVKGLDEELLFTRRVATATNGKSPFLLYRRGQGCKGSVLSLALVGTSP